MSHRKEFPFVGRGIYPTAVPYEIRPFAKDGFFTLASTMQITESYQVQAALRKSKLLIKCTPELEKFLG